MGDTTTSSTTSRWTDYLNVGQFNIQEADDAIREATINSFFSESRPTSAVYSNPVYSDKEYGDKEYGVFIDDGNRSRIRSAEPDSNGEYKWTSAYNQMADKPKRRQQLSYKVSRGNNKINKSIDITKALKSFRELRDKDICEFILTGSVALFIQGKISRKEFHDIDLIAMNKYQLDDDMYELATPDYDRTIGLSEMKSFAFENNTFDIFNFEPDHKIDTIEIEYEGETYLCQDYKEIIMAKFNMILPKMKDSVEIMKCMEFNFK